MKRGCLTASDNASSSERVSWGIIYRKTYPGILHLASITFMRDWVMIKIVRPRFSALKIAFKPMWLFRKHCYQKYEPKYSQGIKEVFSLSSHNTLDGGDGPQIKR